MGYNPHDTYYKKAKREGYRARAAYKLLEIQQRFHLMRAGDVVVDLGAAPGGWLQVAARLVGKSGKVIGVDLQPIATLNEPNIICLQADITSPDIAKKIFELVNGKVDCVLSDLAPHLSGIRDADTARSLELIKTALTVARSLLRPGGCLLAKGFVNQELHGITEELKQHFHSVQRTRPDATRQGSSEFYFVAKGFRLISNK
ncbi:MAG TPA: RlmE family RNA methyltransferase [Candidatus Binatia bacterium]|jgi:23S rRNA (uridine2552-2'-O)-methyltransferase